MMRPEFLDINRVIQDKSVLKLFDAVHRYGGVLRFVGGAVRDALAGNSGFEIDLATDLTPDELLEACSDKGLKTVTLGLKFAKTGVLINNRIYEVSSLYKKPSEGSKISDFSFTDDWNADAANRDLTINAVYADEEGNVFDYYNGIEDLEKGIVRFIGKAEEKIREQPIRIMRFFRFYSIFAKTPPDTKSLAACVENKELLKTISIEQIRNEFFKILTTKNAPHVLDIMFQNEILSFILPQKINTKALKILDDIECANGFEHNIMRRFFVLFTPDPALSESLAVRFKMTKVQKLRLLNLARFSFDIERISDFSYIKRVVFIHDKEFVKDKILLECSIKNKKCDDIKQLFQKIDNLSIPTFPINGKDLIELGMIDCAPIKEILGSLKDLWIASDFQMSYEELQEQAKKLIK